MDVVCFTSKRYFLTFISSLLVLIQETPVNQREAYAESWTMHKTFLLNQAQTLDNELKEKKLNFERQMRQVKSTEDTLHRVLIHWNWEAKQVDSSNLYTSPSGGLSDLPLIEAIRMAFSSFSILASVRVRTPAEISSTTALSFFYSVHNTALCVKQCIQ